MPDPKYRKTVYDNLKQAYGDNFTRTYEDFNSTLDSDPEYRKTVYQNLKQAYGDEFGRPEEEFYSMVGTSIEKKSPIGSPDSGVVSETVSGYTPEIEAERQAELAEQQADERAESKLEAEDDFWNTKTTALKPEVEAQNLFARKGALGMIEQGLGIENNKPEDLMTRKEVYDQVKATRAAPASQFRKPGIMTKTGLFGEPESSPEDFALDQKEKNKELERVNGMLDTDPILRAKIYDDAVKEKAEQSGLDEAAVRKQLTEKSFTTFGNRAKNDRALMDKFESIRNLQNLGFSEESTGELMRLQRDQNRFFKLSPEEQQKEALQKAEQYSWIDPSLSPKEKLERYMNTLQQEWDETYERVYGESGTSGGATADAIASIVPFSGGISRDQNRLFQLQGELEMLAPIVVQNINPAALPDEESALDVGKKSFGNVLSGSEIATSADKFNMVRNALGVAGVPESALEEGVSKELQEKSKYEAWSPKAVMQTVGSTAGFVLPFMTTGGATNAVFKGTKGWQNLSKLAQTGKLGDKAVDVINNTEKITGIYNKAVNALDKTKTALTRAFFSGVKAGAEYEVTGKVFTQTEDEANFLSGFLGAGFGNLTAGTALNKLESIFGTSAPKVVRSMVERGTGETAEEFVQEVYQVYKYSPEGTTLLDAVRKRFPNLSEASFFALSTTLMGIAMGSGNASNDFTEAAETAVQSLPADQREVVAKAVEEFTAEQQEIQTAVADEVVKEIEKEEIETGDTVALSPEDTGTPATPGTLDAPLNVDEIVSEPEAIPVMQSQLAAIEDESQGKNSPIAYAEIVKPAIDSLPVEQQREIAVLTGDEANVIRPGRLAAEYAKAKSSGTNPELVSKVEEFLQQPESAEAAIEPIAATPIEHVPLKPKKGAINFDEAATQILPEESIKEAASYGLGPIGIAETITEWNKKESDKIAQESDAELYRQAEEQREQKFGTDYKSQTDKIASEGLKATSPDQIRQVASVFSAIDNSSAENETTIEDGFNWLNQNYGDDQGIAWNNVQQEVDANPDEFLNKLPQNVQTLINQALENTTTETAAVGLSEETGGIRTAIEEAQGEVTPVRLTGKQIRQQAIAQFRESVKESMSRGYTGVDPKAMAAAVKLGYYLAKSGVTEFSDWSKTMVGKLGKQIKPHLKKIWETKLTTLDDKSIAEVANIKKENKKPRAKADVTVTKTPVIVESVPNAIVPKKKMSIAKNVIKNAPISQSIKDAMLEEGIEYIPKGLVISYEEAKTFLESRSLEQAKDAVLDFSNQMKPDVRNTLAGMVARKYDELSKAATTLTEQKKNDAIVSQIVFAVSRNATEQGRAINAIKNFYEQIGWAAHSMAVEKDFQNRRDAGLESIGGEKTVKGARKAIDAIVDESVNETIAALKEKIAALESQVKKVAIKPKSVNKAIDWLESLKVKGATHAFGLAAELWNAAIATVQRALKLGLTVSQAIDSAVKKVKDSGDPAWDENGFKVYMTENLNQKAALSEKEISKEVKKELGSQIEDIIRRNYSQQIEIRDSLAQMLSDELGLSGEAATNFANEVKRQFNKIVESKQKQILNKIKTPGVVGKKRKTMIDKSLELVNSGALTDEKFKDLYSEGMGVRVLSDAEKAAIKKAAKKIDDYSRFEEQMREKFDPKRTKELKKSKQVAQQAWDDMSRIQANPTFAETMISLIQGTVLTLRSIVQNIWSNALVRPSMAASNIVASAIDHPLSWMFGWERATMSGPRLARGWKGFFAEGVKEGLTGLYTGDISDEKFDGMVRKTLHPITAWKEMLVDKKGVTFDRLMEALPPGIAAETMFRLLNVGDKPFLRGAERAMLFTIAKEKGLLKGKKGETEQQKIVRQEALKKFLALPDPESIQRIKLAGEEATFRNETLLGKIGTSIDRGIDAAIDWTEENAPAGTPKPILAAMQVLKIVKKLNMLFIKTPASVITYTADLYMPSLAVVKSIFYGGLAIKQQRLARQTQSEELLANAKENRRLSEEFFGRAVVGYIAAQVFYALLSTGLMRGDDEDKKKAYTLNRSALFRWVASGFSSSALNEQSGDIYIKYDKLGPIGVAGMGHAQMWDNIPEYKRGYGLVDGFKTFLYEQINLAPLQLPMLSKAAIEQSFAKGTQAWLEVLGSGDTGKWNRYFLSLTRAASAPLVPNAVEDFAKIGRDYEMDKSEQTFLEAAFSGKWTTNEDKYTPLVNVWGEKVDQTPKGYSPVLYNLFSISKPTTVVKDWQYDLAKWASDLPKDERGIALPTKPTKDFKYDTHPIDLTDKPALWVEFQQLIGKGRAALVQDLIESGGWDKMDDAERTKSLEKAYRDGREGGISQFMRAHRDLKPKKGGN